MIKKVWIRDNLALVFLKQQIPQLKAQFIIRRSLGKRFWTKIPKENFLELFTNNLIRMNG